MTGKLATKDWTPAEARKEVLFGLVSLDDRVVYVTDPPCLRDKAPRDAPRSRYQHLPEPVITITRNW